MFERLFVISYHFSPIGKPVAAICHGAWMLCSAKCIKGRRLTSFFAIKDDVENAGYGSYCKLINLKKIVRNEFVICKPICVV